MTSNDNVDGSVVHRGPGMGRVRAWTVLALLVVLAIGALLLTRGGGGATLRVGAPAAVGQDGDGVAEPGADALVEDDETVVVELPSAREGEDPQRVEVERADPDDAPMTEDVSVAAGHEPVPVGEFPLDERRRLLGQPVEVEGRVERPGAVGFWLVPTDAAADRGGSAVFVSWGDADRGLRDGEVVTVSGLWRLAADVDEHLVGAGVVAETPYVHAMGWQR